MSRKLVPVTLIKDGMNCYFESMKAAGEFINETSSHVSKATIKGTRCHGWRVKRGYVEPEPLKPEVIIKQETVYVKVHPVLRTNGLLTPNKTELNYYAYQAEKGAKA